QKLDCTYDEITLEHLTQEMAGGDELEALSRTAGEQELVFPREKTQKSAKPLERADLCVFSASKGGQLRKPCVCLRRADSLAGYRVRPCHDKSRRKTTTTTTSRRRPRPIARQPLTVVPMARSAGHLRGRRHHGIAALQRS